MTSRHDPSLCTSVRPVRCKEQGVAEVEEQARVKDVVGKDGKLFKQALPLARNQTEESKRQLSRHGARLEELRLELALLAKDNNRKRQELKAEQIEQELAEILRELEQNRDGPQPPPAQPSSFSNVQGSRCEELRLQLALLAKDNN